MKQEPANNQIFDRENVKRYPLTQPQQRIWYTELLYPNRNASTIILNAKINGAVNIDILKQAIGVVVQRNDSFRIRIACDNGVPWQYIVPYAEEDLVIGHLEMPQEQAAEWLTRNNVVPFKLLHAPLYEFTIIRIHEEEIWLSFRMHHIATDGVSMHKAIDQMTGFYQELANGTFDAASSLTANSYLDFIQAEQEYEQSDRYQKDKAYWLDKFSEFPETIGLKTYNPLALSTAGRRKGAELSEELHKGINAFCEEHQISLFTFFLSALYIYVHKVTQEQDIPIGTLYANRTSKKEKDTIGMFVSTVATRVRVEPETGLLAFLQSVAKEQSSILRHQRYPYNKVIQDLRETRRSQDIQRLFGGSIQYRTYSFAKFGEFAMQPNNNFCGDIVNDFDIHMVDELDRGKMMLYFDYRTELFDEQEVAQIIRQFLAVAEGMIQSPTQTIQQLSLLSETEKETILNVFNDTAADYPSGQSIAALFEEQAGRTPEQTAVVCAGKALTYGDLNEQANRLARTIRALGVTADDTVGIIAERSAQMVVGILAILKAGGAYVPVDPDYPEERVRYLLEDSGVKVLLTERKELVTEHFKGTILDISRKEVYDENGSDLEPVSGPNHLAYVIYTSGTTGKPKGVMVEQRNVVRLVKNTDFAVLDETTRILQTGSVVFDASTFEIWGALLNGGQLHLVNKDMILNAASLKQTIQENGITTMFLTTALFNQLTQQDSRLFASLDTLLVGGEAQSVPHINRVIQDNPGFRLVNIYGPTENTTFSTAYVIPAERSNTVPIGGPIRNSTAYVVDSAMRLQPVGAWGELLVGGDGVARGYLNQPEQTAEKFIDSPFRQGERCYRTGDLVRWRADGTLEYKGRIDQQVKIRGYRIELGEIEEHLLQVEAVQEAVVIAREDENGQKQLCAYYVAECELGANEVRSALSRELPGYMVPSYFVQVEQIPLTSNGKVDRRALPAPEGSLQTGAEYVAPRTAIEQALVSVWQSVLGVKNVGVLDNFFELGGDSIKAIQVSSRLLQAGYKLEMREIFQYPTVAELGRYVQEASRIADQGEVRGPVAHTPIQLWYLEQNPAEPHHFNQAFLLYRKAGFEEAALRLAVEAIVKHHDALRIVLRKTENGVYETWNRGADGEGSGLYGLEIFDFTQVEHVAEAIETQANAIQNSIQLHDGPLVKLGLFRCADGDHLLIAIHHWVVDGISWRILLEDLTAGYEQALSGAVTIKLPPKTDSFQTWADKLLAHAGSPAMESERQYWLESGAAGFLPLPKDFADVGTPTVGRSEVVSIRWTKEETERLLKQANRAYNTEVNDLLLTAFGIAVHDWTGHNRIAVNLEGHGREPILSDVDVTRTVGWFTSQFPVLLEMGSAEAEKNISHRIRTVKEGLRRIPHRGIGFGILKYLSSMNNGERVFVQEPELSFNYLGQFDQDLEQSGLSLSPHPTGEFVSAQTVMRYPVDVNGMIVGGELEMTIRYDAEAFRADTIERLAGLLQTSLREVLDHCTSKEQPELTPSDLQMKGLSLAQLEQITELMRHVGELEDVFALTPLQKGMLFHSLMDRQAGSYFEQLTLDLEGSFQVEAFRRGFELLVQRHQVLRANYLTTTLTDEPIQVVVRHKPVDFSYEDLRPLEADERLAYAESFLRQDKKRGFDLEQGALMRVSVLQTGDQSYRIVWSFHHILMDGWCLSLMLGEVFESYHAYLSSKQPKLAPVTPYSRYFDWLEKQDYREAEHFWSQYLSGYEQMTLLPRSDHGDAASGFAPVKHIFLLNRELTEKLNRMAKQHQVTLYTLIQTAWGVILQNYNNSSDVVFGSVVSGRPAEIPGVESIVGLFINTIPVRLQAVPGESFARAMIRSQEQTLKTQSYDTYPLFEIQKLTEQKQDLINHIIVFENYPMEEQAEQLLMKGGGESGFAISHVVMSEQTTYDFNMIVMPGDELRFQFEYNANAFDLAEIEQMQHHFVHVLEQIAANPAIPVDKLELVSGQEKELLLHGFNDTAAEYPQERTIHELFEEQAARTPERTAVLFEDERLTYRELNERANRLARTLRAEGVGADVPVAIMVERSPEMIVGIYAILKAGGAYVPIDPEYPAERIRYIAEDSGARLLLTQSRFLDRVPAELEGRVLDLNEGAVYAEDATNLPHGSGPRDMAYVIYTSGSTGKPKGAAIEHHSVLNRILWMHERYPIDEADVILQKTTFTFDVSVWELFWWAMVGSSVCLLTPGGEKNPELILQAISRYGVTTMHFVPAMLHAFLDYAGQQAKQAVAEQTSSLRHVFASGEALPPQHVARFQEAIGRVNRTRLINLYGPTEATVDVSYFECEPDESYAVIPIGKPVHNTRLYILKEGTEQLQPVGVAGELCIAGVQVARGYLNRPELTAEKFTADPFAAGERMYRTGDLARWLPDGNIEYLGRIDHQVKIRGYRIELGELEAELLAVEAVQEAVVMARDDGQGQKQLCAYYVATKELTAGELREALSKELPGYMVPTYFTQVERMPLSANGKIDRKSLPAPEASVQSGEAYAAPRTPVERALANILQTVLGLRTVGIHDNFFDLGGDSIKSIQVASRMMQAGYKLEMKDIFKYPTIASLSAHVRTAVRLADQGEVTGEAPLTPVQRWFFEHNPSQPRHFNQSFMIYRPDRFEEGALRQTFRKLAEHHDALRLVVQDSGSGYQVRYRAVTEGELLDLAVIDLQDREMDDSLTHWIEEKATELQGSIDLNAGPLVKLGLFRCADGDHLLIAVHHLAIDVVSWRILFEDFVTGYEQASKGEALQLPLKTDSFQAWAQGLEQYADSPALDSERAYWQQIEQASCRPLPKDYAYERPQLQDSELITLNWTPEETVQLLKQAHRAYNTEMNDLLLTALGIAIQRWSGQGDVLVSLEGHGREPIIPDLDITRTVGWFTSVYPVLLSQGADMTLRERIKRTKEQLHAIPDKGIGYGLLRYLSRKKQEAPALRVEPEISFNYLGQLDQDLQQHDIRLSPFAGGMTASADTALRFALDLNSLVVDGALQLTIRYSAKQYRRETVEQFAGHLHASLQEVIAHCVSKDRTELTPSDVSLKGVTIEELERLMLQTAAIGEIENVYNLTPMQKGILFHGLLEAGSGAYFEQTSFDLKGEFEPEAFAQSIDLLVQRHEALRTNFYTAWKENPVQVVFRSKRGTLVFEDLSGFSNEEREAEIARFKREDRDKGFDLARDPLLRIAILRTGSQEHHMIWSFHHIIMDGWCLSIVVQEVFEAYFALVRGKKLELSEVWAYSSYIEWLERQNTQEASAYWSGYLSGYEEQTLLPAGKPGNSEDVSGYRAQRYDYELGSELTKRIHQTAKAHQVTINTLIQAAWGIVLQRYNGTDDAVFGSVVSGRPAEIPGVERIIGLFINTIPVRIRCAAEESFADVMKRAQEQAIASNAYETFPLYEIQALTEQKQDLIRHIVIFENYPVDERMEQLGGEHSALRLSGVQSMEQTNYDLNLVVLPGESMKLYIGYNEAAFEPIAIERIQAHLTYLLEQVVANPDIRIHELELVSGAEKEQILYAFNDTAVNSPRDKTIYQLLEEQTMRTPEKVAVYCEGQRLTYRELNERANRLARTLRSAGVRRDRFVGLMVERSLEMIVGVFAILKAGGAYVPIDPEYPEDRIRYMLEDSGAKLLLTQERLRERIAADLKGVAVLAADDEANYDADGSNLEPVSGADDLAYVIYTSGTTGKPKGVMLEHHGLTNLKAYYDHTLRIGVEDRALLFASLSFDAACWEIFQALFCGATLYVPTKDTILNYQWFQTYMAEHRITVAALPPTYAVYLEPEQMPSLRILFTAGSASSPELVQKWKDKVAYYNGYGPTENSVATSIWPVSEDPEAGSLISIGRPMPNHRVYIVDRHGHLLPAGVAGELCVAGAGLARGYLDRPELTAEAFVTSRFSGERMYRTGDLARWLPDGRLEYLGRIDHQVKIRGYRIELGEIEAKLLQFEAVQEVIVIAREDGQGQQQLCAYYVASEELAASELRQVLSEKLPSYMVPAHFVQLEAMPLTPNDKIDRKALPEPDGSGQSGADYAPPRTPVERSMAAIWQAVLGTSAVGIHDNFFELGGDSIKSIQVSSRLLQQGYKLEMKDLFAYPTIAGLSPYVQATGAKADQGAVTGEAPLTPIQHWFFEQNFAEPHYFNQALLLHRAEGFEEAALRQAFAKLIEHHDALRMVYKAAPDGFTAWNREVHEGKPLELSVFDYRDADHVRELVESKASELQAGIDLQEGPLLKLGLFRCADGDHLLIAIHHLVIDGVSWRILFEDLKTAYEQAVQGETIRLPHKTDSFRTWSEELRKVAVSDELQRELAYWRDLEKAETAVLPKEDGQAGGLTLADSGTVTVEWSAEATGQLLKQANRAYNTNVNDLLLTALGLAVQDWTGQERLLISLEGHGREADAIGTELDLSRTIGWFTSQYPVLLTVEGSQALGKQIKRVKEDLRRIPRKGIGYGILRYLSELPEAERLQLEPEISFNYLGQFDEDLQNGAFGFSPYSSGQSVSAQTALQHALTFNGMVSGGRLTMTLLYNAKAFRLETIEYVAQLLHDRLVEVLEHCVTKEQAELTPSDVQRKGLTIDELEELIRQAEQTGEVENVYALTPMQKGMLFHSLLEPKSGAYFQQATFELVGRFDVGAFAQSLELLVQRHTVLRTNIVNDSRQEPLQMVYKSKASEFYFEDVRGLGDAEQRAYVVAFAAKDQARGFDLAADALMRIGILQTGDTEYSFVWSFHHIVMDGWCISLLYQEVFGAYFAIRQKREVKLPQVTPYVRYMEWLDKQDADQAAAYWKEYLSGYEQHTDLPNRKTADAKQRYELEKVSRLTGKPLSAALQRTAKAHQVTINTLMQTAWGIALQRYNNSTDVVFGSVVSGRPADIPGVEGIIGLFINTIPVRVQSGAGESFAHMLKRGQAQAIESNAYDTYPLYEIQAHTAQKQDLINHILIFENYPLDEEIERIGERGPDTFEIRNARMNEQTNYDFTVTIMPGADIRIDFGYNAVVYDREDVERIQEHFIHLLEQVTANPDVSVDKLELVTAREKEMLLSSFNDNTAEYPREQTIHGLFEEQVRRLAERIAVTCGNEHMTYRELNERANRLARTLRAEGVGADVPVAIMVERSLEMIVGIYAILKAGGAYVPIDPEYPAERVHYIVEDSGARLLLTQSRFLDRVPAELEGWVLDLNEEAVYAEDATNLPPGSGPRDMAYVIYTSGSTGKPKGAAIEHHSVLNRILWMHERYPIGEADVILQKTTFTFDVSVWELFWWAMVGSSVCLLTPGGEKNPELILQAISRYGVTTMHFVPAMLHAFLDYAEQQAKQAVAEQTSSLRHVFASGEALPPQHVARFQEAIGRVNRTRLINLYGPTEATVDVSYFDCEPDESYAVIPIGKPVHNTRLYILKEGTEQLQPVGVAGELCIAGVQVARGYLNKPELTAEKFTADPFVAGERMYRTGDLARWLPDGNIEYLGRIDHQVKIRGYRIELGELETELLRVDSVLESVVVARDDGQGQKLLCAYYVAAKELTAGELREALSKELPSYMLPTFFVQVERMPLTANGKVDRKALPAPEASLQSGQGYAAPSTQTEAQLARIWQEVLGLEKVGVKDNFFEIGGHSLRAATLVARIQKELQISVPLRSVFEHPTVEELAAVMAGRKKTGETSLPVAEERDYYPLSSVQKRLYILSQLQKNDISYNLPSVLRVEGPLDVKRIEEAFRALIARHESLRTSFEMVDGEPVQRVHAQADFSIEVREGSEQEAEGWMENFLRPFDLRKPPLMRVELIKLESERYIMQFDMHHIITDGASMGILVQELVRLYGGEELPPLRIQYKDYAVWQQGARARTYEEQEQYWLETLAGELPALEVPTDYPRPAVRSFDGSRVNFELDAELTSAVKRLSEETGSTLFMVLLAAYQALLAHYSGQEDIIVGTPIAGRPLAELEPVIGMFVNTLALRAYPSENKTFLELLQEVKEQALGAFENQEFAFEELVEKLVQVQDASRNPLFDTMLVLQNNERQELKFDSVSFVRQERDYNVAKFDLTLYFIEEGDRINGSLEYSTKLFKAHTMEKYASDFAALLRTVTDRPTIRLGDIELADQVSVESVEFMF